MKMKYPDKWAYQITDTNHLKTIVRANLTSKIDAVKWVKEYSILNNTCWNVGNHYAKNKCTTRYLLHKRWVCHHSKLNKRSGSRRCTFCEASIDIYIKVMTKNTRHKDAFLRMTPPLQATITISPVHNHDTESTESLQLLRGADDTKRMFAEYFDTGLPVATAIRLHQAKLRATDSPEKFLANRSMNPTSNMIYYWSTLHKAGKLKNVDDESTKPPEEKYICESEGNDGCRQLDADGSAVMADVERVWLPAMEGDPSADPNTELPTLRDPIGTVQQGTNKMIRDGDNSMDTSPRFVSPVDGGQRYEQPVDSESSTVDNRLPPGEEIPYKCDECPKAFRHEDSFTRRTDTTHGSADRPYSCQICAKTFLRKHDLHPHAASHAVPLDKPRKRTAHTPHARTPDESFKTRETAVGGRVTPERAEWVEPRGPFSCRKCQDGFARTEDLAAHILTHAVDILPAPARLGPRGDGPPRTAPERSRNSARKCRAVAGLVSDKDEPFAGSGASRRERSVHRRLEGIDARTFECVVPTCGKRYLLKKHLNEHVLSHFPVNYDPCTICGNAFCHNGECFFKKYESMKYDYRTLLACMYCPALFTTSSKLEEHMRSHFILLSTEVNVTSRTTVELERVAAQEIATLPSESSNVLGDAEAEDIKEQLLVPRPASVEETPQLLPLYDLSESFATKIEETTDPKSRPSSHALGNSYPCDICNKNFCRKCYFSEHGSADAPLTCESCSTVFTLRCKLEKHVVSHVDAPSAEVSGKGSAVDVDYIEEQEVTCSPRENPGVLVDTKEFGEEEATHSPRETLGMLVDTKELAEQELTCSRRETPGALVDTKELEERLRVTIVRAQLDTRQSLPVPDFPDSVVDIKQEITVGDVESPGATLHDEFRGKDLENTNVMC